MRMHPVLDGKIVRDIVVFNMDVGAELREARERRGISLEELARITKIGVATLRALERNQVDHLPGGIFLRGFLRAYARQVELDQEDTVRRYLARTSNESRRSAHSMCTAAGC